MIRTSHESDGGGRPTRHRAPAPGHPLWRRPEVLLGALLMLAIFAAYWQVYGAGYARNDGRVAENPGFIWDDEDYVFQNPHLPDPKGLERIWLHRSESPQYYPLVFTTFWLEYRIWGGPDANGKLKAGGYHFTNILLHAINALLIWGILRRVRFRGAFAVAAIFALHPFCVESVAWVTERKNVLSLFFYLLAMGALLRWEDEPGARRWRWWGLAFGLFLLGLFSKTVIASLPVAMLILRWWRRRPVTRDYALALLPFLALGFGMGRLTAEHEQEFVLLGDAGPYWQLSFFDRVLIAGRALWFYVGKILWPHPLVFNYTRWNIDTAAIGQWLWPLAALAAAGGLLVLARRGRRGPLAAGLFYAVSVFPALGFVNVAPMRFSFVADHFAYLASLGVIAAGVGLVVEVIDRRRDRGAAAIPFPKPALAALAAVLLLLGGLTWKQTSIYRDIEYLWRDTIAHYPQSHLARINLGVLLRHRGELDEARGQFERVLADWPDWPWTRSRALTNLGNLEQGAGRLDEAIRDFREAAEVLPIGPEPRYNLANALLLKGEFDEAIRYYEGVLDQYPTHVNARYNLGYALEQVGRLDEAQAHYAQVTRANPNSAQAWLGAARIAQVKGDPAGALEGYRRARRLDPSSGVVVLGEMEALLQLGRRGEGMQLASSMLARSGGDQNFRFEIARRLRSAGEHAEAIRIARESLAASPGESRFKLLLIEELSAAPDARLRNGEEALALALELTGPGLPEDPPSLSVLAAAYAETGRFADAQATMRRAIALARERGMGAILPTFEDRLRLFTAGQALRLP